MDNIFKKFFTSVINLIPVVRAEDEEEELVDPQVVLREQCGRNPECAAYQAKYQACNDRVRSRKKTAEVCTEELIDFMHCVDHCVAHSIFTKLK